eukprot:m.491650 g.491650  ORF g.491650 m.491650 type:complete len:275 (+) comp30456_c0_seq1:60-884(+)
MRVSVGVLVVVGLLLQADTALVHAVDDDVAQGSSVYTGPQEGCTNQGRLGDDGEDFGLNVDLELAKIDDLLKMDFDKLGEHVAKHGLEDYASMDLGFDVKGILKEVADSQKRTAELHKEIESLEQYHAAMRNAPDMMARLREATRDFDDLKQAVDDSGFGKDDTVDIGSLKTFQDKLKQARRGQAERGLKPLDDDDNGGDQQNANADKESVAARLRDELAEADADRLATAKQLDESLRTLNEMQANMRDMQEKMNQHRTIDGAGDDGQAVTATD